jgi:hypothetical protein
MIAQSSAKKTGLVGIKDRIENLRPALSIVDQCELQTNRHLEEAGKQQNRDSVWQNQTQAEYNS